MVGEEGRITGKYKGGGWGATIVCAQSSSFQRQECWCQQTLVRYLHFGVKGQCRIQVCGCIAISLVWVLFGVG